MPGFVPQHLSVGIATISLNWKFDSSNVNYFNNITIKTIIFAEYIILIIVGEGKAYDSRYCNLKSSSCTRHFWQIIFDKRWDTSYVAPSWITSSILKLSNNCLPIRLGQGVIKRIFMFLHFQTSYLWNSLSYMPKAAFAYVIEWKVPKK